MKSISLSVNVLKAAMLCCSTNDVRYYLQGICISDQAVISTDGRIMFKYPLDGNSEHQYIIHYEDLKTLFKNLDKEVTRVDFVKLDNAYYFISEGYRQLVPLIDAKYPDTTRVINSAERSVSGSEGIKQIRLNHKYLMLVSKVTKALKLHKFDYPLFDFSTSTGKCIISYETCNVKMYYIPCSTRPVE